ncbi:MAG: GNAT family N-acetyltransferase [Lachnospiraceae bacterium]
MAVYHVKEKETIVPLLAGWQETFIWSCLQNCMGEAYTDNLKNPQSAEIMLGDFCFFAGNVNHELMCNKPANHNSEFIIMIPQNKEWEKAIELMLVAGAYSYAFYKGGIEVEIDTKEEERRKGLALVCAVKLIMECLERGLYPSWDAHNKESLALAEKLGYVFDKKYPAYEIIGF